MVTKKTVEEAEIVRQTHTQRQTAKYVLITIFAILLSGTLRAIGLQAFIVPNDFAPGGVTGLAAILEYKTRINAGIWLFACNVPLVIVAFIFVGKRFAIITTSAIIVSSALMVLFEKVGFPSFIADGTKSDRILPAIAGGILCGAGVAIMLKVGGSSGGTDIIATLVQKKYSATNVAWFIFAIDSSVVLASAFVYEDSMVPVLLSFVEMFCSSKIAETILQGFKSAIKFEVVTNTPEELSKAIIDKLGRGVTMLDAKGMYTGENHALLICIVHKRQMSAFRQILKQFPDSFAYIGSTSEVMGKGFNS